MTDTITLEEAKAKYNALVKEREEINAKLVEAETLRSRLRTINGGFSTKGEIEKAQLVMRDAAFPVYEKNRWGGFTRITCIDNKWICLRDDGDDDKEIKRYKKDTGWLERSRDGYYKIDAQKAIEIWENHQKGAK